MKPENVTSSITLLEAIVLDRASCWYREEDDGIEGIVSSIECCNRVYYGIDIGEVSAKDVKAAYDGLWSKGMLTRVNPQIASEMINERVTSVGVEDIGLSDVMDLLLLTDTGLIEWDKWFNSIRGSWIEEDSTRWFIRGTGSFSLSDFCTAMKDNPQSYRCCQLDCRLERIGPWAQAENFVMPSGWRLICKRRADGN